METFNFSPNWRAELSKTPKVKNLVFGDGYEQRAPEGLNHNLRRYTLRFSGTMEHIRQIESFLDRHGGYKAFYWTPRHSDRRKFKCEEWKITESEGFGELNCEFQEVVA